MTVANKRAADGIVEIGGSVGKKPQKTKAKQTAKENEMIASKKAKWRRDHDELVKAIKMSRLIKKVEAEGGDISKIPVAPSAPNEDYVE